ncbi:hypothetical protein X758_32820 [Mesorhizobium sp. LSHC416B00]|nr:hypothetical protein X758_32820 [Mesorhizobium sp. LSHC416B00]
MALFDIDLRDNLDQLPKAAALALYLALEAGWQISPVGRAQRLEPEIGRAAGWQISPVGRAQRLEPVSSGRFEVTDALRSSIAP